MEGDHIGTSRVTARVLHSIFNSLGTRGDKRRFLFARHWRNGVELFAKFNEGGVRHHRGAGVGKFFQLLINPLHDKRMPVARVDDSDAAAKIHIAVAFDIPDFGVLSPHCHRGCRHANGP